METLIRKTKHFTDNKRGFYRPYHSPLLKPRQITQTIFEFFFSRVIKNPPDNYSYEQSKRQDLVVCALAIDCARTHSSQPVD